MNWRAIVQLLLLATCCSAAAQDVRVRTSVADPPPIWVGQRVTLVVELLSPTYFSGVPSFDFPQVSGLLITPPAERPTLGSETIDGQTFTVQRHELSMMCQRAGTVTVPGFSVRFAISAGIGKPPIDATVTTKPTAITFKQPPGTEGISPLISTRKLTMEGNWSTAASDFEVGDALTERVTMRVQDLPPMLLPPLSVPTVDGLKVYPQTPALSDESSQEKPGGQRVESFVIVCTAPGRHVVPGYALRWWNMETQSIATATIPARAITVVTPMPAAKALNAAHANDRTYVVLIALVGGSGAVLTIWLLRRWQRNSADAEAVAFRLLAAACHQNDIVGIAHALTLWQSTSGICVQDAPVLAAQIEVINRTIYGGSCQQRDSISSDLILKHLKELRHKSAHRAGRQKKCARGLVTLNPMATLPGRL